MSKIEILEETCKNPLNFMGKVSGICYGTDTTDVQKNVQRAFNCLESDHMRVAEYPKLVFIIDGYSAKVIREWYTHIIDTTRLQSSTRYINYSNFDYITPPAIQKNKESLEIYNSAMSAISEAMCKLKDLGIKNEDFSGLLPLNYSTKIVVSIGLREFIQMCRKRRCTRAYHEYRELIQDILNELTKYSDDYKKLFALGYFDCQCDWLGYCPEKKGCGKYPIKEN